MRNRRRVTAGHGQDEKLTTNQRWVCYVVVEELKLFAISPLPSRRGGGTRRDRPDKAGQGRDWKSTAQIFDFVLWKLSAIDRPYRAIYPKISYPSDSQS